jgi:hypothetical protein
MDDLTDVDAPRHLLVEDKSGAIRASQRAARLHSQYFV